MEKYSRIPTNAIQPACDTSPESALALWLASKPLSEPCTTFHLILAGVPKFREGCNRVCCGPFLGSAAVGPGQATRLQYRVQLLGRLVVLGRGEQIKEWVGVSPGA